ncbi:MAG: GGDEF domain-containing protein, partial [Myxococcales bacterium]|nr:GGDEF domain-containing protein [Myxococcales bacterium]
PLVLRAAEDSSRDRFWARHAGAAGYVQKGRMGELVRTLERVIREAPASDFFFQLSGGAADVRARIAAQLDRALFDSVVAAEIRALGSLGGFERLLDRLSQLLVQLVPYHWLALTTDSPPRLGLHCHPGTNGAVHAAAARALDLAVPHEFVPIEDADAEAGWDPSSGATVVTDVHVGATAVGRLAVALPPDTPADARRILQLVARELGGPLRIVNLVEETQRLAEIDRLTGLPRRHCFVERLSSGLLREDRPPLVVALLDLDHFKLINDHHGHAVGDAVLAATGACLAEFARAPGVQVARWGGEEFVAALTQTSPGDARALVETLCARLRALRVDGQAGEPVAISASVGLAMARPDDDPDRLIDRADRAMYVAKSSGRDRICTEADLPSNQATVTGGGAPADSFGLRGALTPTGS